MAVVAAFPTRPAAALTSVICASTPPPSSLPSTVLRHELINLLTVIVLDHPEEVPGLVRLLADMARP